MAEEELQQQLILAAEIGKQLLESNKSLEEQLNKNSEEYTKHIEELEQGRYSLQMKIESKTRMELNYLDEIDNLKHTLKNQKVELLYVIEAEHNSKISPLRSQVTGLQCELEKSQLNCQQLQEQVEKMLTEIKEQRLSSLNETCSEENAMLHVEVGSLQTDKMNLMKELQKEPQWLLQVDSLRRQLTSKEDEVEEKQCQATSYFNALEKSREEIQELKVQLDIIKTNINTKGNSLFSEVDRRVAAEKQLITVQVQHEALKKKHDMMCQNWHKLKMQMAGLLQMSGAHADVHHMKRMQEQLSQARSEIQVLSAKLRKHEKQEKGLLDHITDQEEEGYQCFICFKWLQTLSRFRQHCTRLHDITIEKQSSMFGLELPKKPGVKVKYQRRAMAAQCSLASVVSICRSKLGSEDQGLSGTVARSQNDALFTFIKEDAKPQQVGDVESQLQHNDRGQLEGDTETEIETDKRKNKSDTGADEESPASTYVYDGAVNREEEDQAALNIPDGVELKQCRVHLSRLRLDTIKRYICKDGTGAGFKMGGRGPSLCDLCEHLENCPQHTKPQTSEARQAGYTRSALSISRSRVASSAQRQLHRKPYSSDKSHPFRPKKHGSGVEIEIDGVKIRELKYYKCADCTFPFSKLPVLSTHQAAMEHSGVLMNTYYMCPNCPKTFTSKEACQEHTPCQCKHEAGPGMLALLTHKCTLCKTVKVFLSSSAMEQHMLAYHKDVSRPTAPTAELESDRGATISSDTESQSSAKDRDEAESNAADKTTGVQKRPATTIRDSKVEKGNVISTRPLDLSKERGKSPSGTRKDCDMCNTGQVTGDERKHTRHQAHNDESRGWLKHSSKGLGHPMQPTRADDQNGISKEKSCKKVTYRGIEMYQIHVPTCFMCGAEVSRKEVASPHKCNPGSQSYSGLTTAIGKSSGSSACATGPTRGSVGEIKQVVHYKCLICLRSFPNKNACRFHQLGCLREKGLLSKNQCRLCLTMFYSWELFIRHLRMDHSLDEVDMNKLLKAWCCRPDSGESQTGHQVELPSLPPAEAVPAAVVEESDSSEVISTSNGNFSTVLQKVKERVLGLLVDSSHKPAVVVANQPPEEPPRVVESPTQPLKRTGPSTAQQNGQVAMMHRKKKPHLSESGASKKGTTRKKRDVDSDSESIPSPVLMHPVNSNEVSVNPGRSLKDVPHCVKTSTGHGQSDCNCGPGDDRALFEDGPVYDQLITDGKGGPCEYCRDETWVKQEPLCKEETTEFLIDNCGSQVCEPAVKDEPCWESEGHCGCPCHVKTEQSPVHQLDGDAWKHHRLLEDFPDGTVPISNHGVEMDGNGGRIGFLEPAIDSNAEVPLATITGVGLMSFADGDQMMAKAGDNTQPTSSGEPETLAGCEQHQEPVDHCASHGGFDHEPVMESIYSEEGLVTEVREEEAATGNPPGASVSDSSPPLADGTVRMRTSSPEEHATDHSEKRHTDDHVQGDYLNNDSKSTAGMSCQADLGNKVLPEEDSEAKYSPEEKPVRGIISESRQKFDLFLKKKSHKKMGPYLSKLRDKGKSLTLPPYMPSTKNFTSFKMKEKSPVLIPERKKCLSAGRQKSSPVLRSLRATAERLSLKALIGEPSQNTSG